MTRHSFEAGPYAVVMGWDLTHQGYYLDIFQRVPRRAHEGPTFGLVVYMDVALTLADVVRTLTGHGLTLPPALVYTLAADQETSQPPTLSTRPRRRWWCPRRAR